MQNTARTILTVAALLTPIYPATTATAVPTVAQCQTADATAAAICVVRKPVPTVPGDGEGRPLHKCGPENDGERVNTEDWQGGRHAWICKFNSNLFGPDEWEWLEIMSMEG